MMVQDIIPPEKRSIRNIPLRRNTNTRPDTPSVAQTQNQTVSSPAPTQTATQDLPQRIARPEDRLSYSTPEPLVFDEIHEQYVPRDNTKATPSQPLNATAQYMAPTQVPFDKDVHTGGKRGFVRTIVTFAVVCGVLGGGVYAYAQYFGGATVSVQPKTEEVLVNGVYEFKEGDFKVFEGTKNITFAVKASGEEEVESKAKGTITIINEHSTSPQRLITNTRFESESGKIYRIQEAVTIPGYTMSGGVKSPGTIDVQVVADGVGASYDVSSSRFTIPGLANDPRFKTMYARTKTAIRGGATGTQKKVSDADVESAYTAAIADAKLTLNLEMSLQIPGEEFAIVPSLIFIEESNPEQIQSELAKPDEAVYAATIKAHAIGLSQRVIQAYILQSSKKRDSTSDSVIIRSWNGVTVEPDRKTQSPWTEDVLRLRINGTVPISWYYNEEKLRTDLSGKPKSQLREVLAGYTGIDQAEAIVRPFWKTTFPVDASDILIKEE